MIDRIIEFSIRNRVLVILAGLGLAVAGLQAVRHTPVDAIPDLSENQVIVFTDCRGQGPRTVEDQVTYPLSVSLHGIAGVRVVRSSSEVGFSWIHVIFDDAVGVAEARRRVSERLAEAAPQLPAGTAPRLAPDALATGQIYWYTVEGPGYDLGRLRAVQDWFLRPQLAAVPGVAEVASVGGAPVEYLVEVDPRRLHALGVPLADVVRAIGRSNRATGGSVVHAANAEYVVQYLGWLGYPPTGDPPEFDAGQALHDLESIVVPLAAGGTVRVGDVAHVVRGARTRRGVLEKDGNEVTGGVVTIRNGENPLEVTRRIQDKLAELQDGLPPGVRVVPFYDRTPLIRGALATVTGTLAEAMVTATVCILLVLLHVRTALLIAVTLPLSALAGFAALAVLRRLGLADVQTNIMSLAGIAISVGVLVDSSMVMAENVLHRLRAEFGDRPVRGDIRGYVLPACLTVGRPLFFAVIILVLSFLPVFGLGGLEGKMFRPLAWTKTLTLLGVAVLAITLVPALCTVFLKGRLRPEADSWIVRSVTEVYRPVLEWCLDRPGPLVWFLALTFVVGFAPLGDRRILLGTLAVGLLAVAACVRGRLACGWACASLVAAAFLAERTMTPLAREFITPLDEGMVMDMPITVPRASIAEAGDDLKARDMVLCRFPEVEMVVGKAGRAESPLDPAPTDMIETMVSLRPAEFWPRRRLAARDAARQARAVLDAAIRTALIIPPPDRARRDALVADAVAAALPRFDAVLREFAYQRNQEFLRRRGVELIRGAVADWLARQRPGGRLGALPASALPPRFAENLLSAPSREEVAWLARQVTLDLARAAPEAPSNGSEEPRDALERLVRERQRALWREHLRILDAELRDRAPATFTRLVTEELLHRATVRDPAVAAALRAREQARLAPPTGAAPQPGHHHGGGAPLPLVDPVPEVDGLIDEQARRCAGWLLLWRADRAELTGFGGELDRAVRMPGWTNVWTMPIQNRVDMLATGVNTTIGIRVLGRRQLDVIRASEAVADVVKRVPGAADVVADPLRGKGYLEIRLDHDRAARWGVSPGDLADVVETAVGGSVVTETHEGRERHPVRVRYPHADRADVEAIGKLLVPARGLGPPFPAPEDPDRAEYGSERASPPSPELIPLAQVADVRIVDGPASIRSENGLLRNYVRLNVRGRDVLEFVAQARAAVATQVTLPRDVFLEWTGQFEHQARARTTLWTLTPLVLAAIVLVLYVTYHSLLDAALMLVAVPGALAGGVLFQWLWGFPFTVTVWVGYIACFGMATSTGIIMLVYLREAVERAGGAGRLTEPQLRRAVLDGAVNRLRPKLLTEGTVVLGLAPLLWATGTGAEILKPMTAPVLGGILVADEVIDLLLPVLFYWSRRGRLGRPSPSRLE